MYPGIEAHDLGHYAVETVLHFQHAFYGMVAKGTNIEDFELPREKRPEKVLPKNLHPEALISEHMVNLLLTRAQRPDDLFDVVESLKPILRENKLPFPEHLTNKAMEKIWALFQKLNEQWTRLPVGETMELEFGN